MVAPSEESTVLFRKDGAVASVILNRPHVINAFDIQMRDDLYVALEAARDDPDVRAIMISGAGERGFCAGADLSEFGSAPSQAIARQVRWERDLWGLFLSISKPMVAAPARLRNRLRRRDSLPVRRQDSRPKRHIQNARNRPRHDSGGRRQPDPPPNHRPRPPR